MNWLVVHIVSGQVFFTGVALIVIAAIASMRRQVLARRVAVLLFLIGIIAVVVSSTAISYGYYALAAGGTLLWILSLLRKPAWSWGSWTLAGVWLGAALLELPYHLTPSLQPASDCSLAVLGDSVTAGIGDSETSETWPRILARTHQLKVQDISHVGETAASALERARTHSVTASVVVIEIGGNDLLGSTTSAEFALDLDALLTHLASPARQLVMLELPLPPFYHEFGRVQRTLSAKHRVVLVPKRVFLSVLAGQDSTLDSIHLSQAGHQLMADAVWCLIKSAFEAKSAGAPRAPHGKGSD